MKRLIFLCILFSCQSVFADDPVLHSKGVGTRALSLGNSFVALADDFTAVYWNPGGLAFIPVRELQMSLDYLYNDMNSDLAGSKSKAMLQHMRLGHAGFLRSIPASRGGFSFAVGYTNPIVLDNIYSFKGWDQYLGLTPRPSNYWSEIIEEVVGSTIVYDTIVDTLNYGDWMYFEEGKNRVHGQLGMISASAGWRIVQGLGFGVTLSFILGREHQNIRSEKYIEIEDDLVRLFEYSEKEIHRSYTGVDVRAGLLFRPIEWLNIGMCIAAPQFIRFDQEIREKELLHEYIYPEEYNTGRLKSSFSGMLGAAFKLPFLILATQANARAPIVEAEEGSDRSYWKIGLSSGIEVPIPALYTLVRAGYSWSELDLQPYEVKWDGEIISAEPSVKLNKGCHMITGGISFLFKEFFVVETAYSYSFREYTVIEEDWLNSTDEDHSTHRVQASFSVHY